MPASHTEPSWRIELREAERVVVVTTEGSFALQTFLAMVPEALAAGAERGYTRFVLDYRLMRPRLATSEIYELPVALERLGWRRGMHVAVVHAASHASAAEFQFFANLAVARAFQYCLFTEFEAALAWVAAAEPAP